MPTADDLFGDHRFKQTYSGGRFYLYGDNPDEIQLSDICLALSHLCRFTGHVKRIYTVAEHSLFVHDILVHYNRGPLPPAVALQALLHDSTEAYLSDIAAPFKGELKNYKELEERTWNRIADKYEVPRGMPKEIKCADWIALFAEAKELQPNATLEDWIGYDPFFHASQTLLPELPVPHLKSEEAGMMLFNAVLEQIHLLRTEKFAINNGLPWSFNQLNCRIPGL